MSQIMCFLNPAILKCSNSQIQHFSNSTFLKFSNSQIQQFSKSAIWGCHPMPYFKIPRTEKYGMRCASHVLIIPCLAPNPNTPPTHPSALESVAEAGKWEAQQLATA